MAEQYRSQAPISYNEKNSFSLTLQHGTHWWLENSVTECVIHHPYDIGWGFCLSAYWLRSKCSGVLLAHSPLILHEGTIWNSFHCWTLQVLCMVTAQGDGRCPATTMAITSYDRKLVVLSVSQSSLFLKNCVVWWCYQVRGTAWISAFFLCIPLWHNFCSLTMLNLCLHAILWCDKDKVFSHKSLTYNYVLLQGVTWSVLITGWFTMAFLYLLRGPSPWLNFIFHGKK